MDHIFKFIAFWVKCVGIGWTMGYPFWPYVVSNRLYLYVQIPFLNGKQKLVMNDIFDAALPDSWDIHRPIYTVA